MYRHFTKYKMAEVERATRLQRLDDSTSSLLEAYARLTKSAQVHGATEQQASSFQSSVLVAGLVSTANLGQPCARATMCPPCVPTACAHRVLFRAQLHATDNLLAISGELKRAKLLNDDSGVVALAAQHRSRDAESRSKCAPRGCLKPKHTI